MKVRNVGKNNANKADSFNPSVEHIHMLSMLPNTFIFHFSDMGIGVMWFKGLRIFLFLEKIYFMLQICKTEKVFNRRREYINDK